MKITTMALTSGFILPFGIRTSEFFGCVPFPESNTENMGSMIALWDWGLNVGTLPILACRNVNIAIFN